MNESKHRAVGEYQKSACRAEVPPKAERRRTFDFAKSRPSKKESFGEKTPPRFRILKLIFMFAAVIIFWRLFILQIFTHKYYVELASGQQDIYKELEPERGEILFRDGKTGQLYPLAVNQNFYNVFAEPKNIEQKEVRGYAYKLAPLLEMTEDEIMAKLSKKDDPHEPLKSKISEETYKKIKELNLPGIGADKTPVRFYPEKDVGGQILGFVGEDESGERRGKYGIEGYFDNELKGEKGFMKSERDALGRLLFVGDFTIEEARRGFDIVLTLDRNIQFFACQKLKEAVARHGADGGTVIILNPLTGAILAMCSAPNFDPNEYNKIKDISVFNNPAIFYQYEPGSIFKVVTMSAGLDLEKVNPNSMYNDSGEVKIGSHTIQNSDLKSYGTQTTTQVLEKSLNTGAVFVARRVGAKDFRQYVENFGFGSPLGLELQKEVSGDTSSLREKNEIYLATASFGQGISVTPLQIVSAFAAIANGGVLMKPYIVEEIKKSDGMVLKTGLKEIRKVISERTSNLLGAMLVSVVERGHGKRAGVAGYFIAGKTGTAQVPKKGGRGYEEGVTIGSFAGFGPVNNPIFAMMVKIDNPKDVQWAESTAAPVFGEIAKFLLQYFEIPPER